MAKRVLDSVDGFSSCYLAPEHPAPSSKGPFSLAMGTSLTVLFWCCAAVPGQDAALVAAQKRERWAKTLDITFKFTEWQAKGAKTSMNPLGPLNPKPLLPLPDQDTTLSSTNR